MVEGLGEDLRKNSGVFGYSQNMWDGKLLSHHLHAKYGIDTGTGQCRRIFRKLGFRIWRPRRVIAKVDKEKKDNFKKIQWYMMALGSGCGPLRRIMIWWSTRNPIARESVFSVQYAWTTESYSHPSRTGTMYSRS